MKKNRIAALLMSAVMLGTSVFTAGIGVGAASGKPVENFQYNEYKKFISYRSPLTNTYKRLTEDESLKIVYFGGSVTAGYGATDSSNSWASKTTKWFEDSFAEAKITAVNTAIGESGTFLGTYRLERDVINQSPDLLFIEYAINDYYKGSDKETAALQYETIVREVRTALPKCDIVTVLTTDENVVGTLYPSASGHEEMAKNYGISSVNVGAALWEEIGKSKENWSTYFTDCVHPTDAGYGLYYKYIEEYLKNALLCTDFSNATASNYKLGSVYSAHLLDGNRTSVMGNKLSGSIVEEKSKGFTYSDEYFAGGGETIHNGCYVADSTDSQITFKFSGTELALWSNFYKTSELSYSVDGGEAKTITGDSHAPTQVVTGLKSGDHTITISPVTFGSNTDNKMKIHAILTRDEAFQTVKASAEDSAEFEFGDLAGVAGDVDVDTYITAADLAQLKKILLGKAKAQSEKTADANSDGAVDIIDLVNLKKTLANKEKAYFDKGITVLNGSEADKSTYIYQMNASGLQVREADIDLGTDTGNELVITHLSDFHLIAMNEADNGDSVLVQSYANRKSAINSQGNLLKNAQNAMEYASFFGKTVITGDTVDFMSQGALDLFKSVVGGSGALAAVGNHEYRKVWYGTYVDNTPIADRYAALQGSWPYNNIYYHSEILKNKVMLIVMNNGAGSDTQHYYAEEFTSSDALGNSMTGTMDKFLAADIATAKEKGYAVLIFQHCPISTGKEADKKVYAIDGNGDGSKDENGKRYQDFYSKYAGTNNETDVDSAVYKLITENASVIKGLFGGHVHGHYYTEVSAKSTPDSNEKDTVIPQYSLTCNAYNSGSALKITVKY